MPLREYVEAIFDEQRRQRVTDEQEREKSASALRTELARQIEQGDEALKDHIAQQIDQLKLLLEGVRREMTIIYESQKEAIQKAETATEKRFESVNEWRAQSADRERSQAEQMGLFTSEFVRLDVHKAEMEKLQQQIEECATRLAKLV